MGEEKKEEEKKEEEAPKEEAIEIVMKVDMHCEACARKVARALKGFEGVEEVTTDSKASKVVVKGKAADPVKVSERLQKKSGKKVELISPLPKPMEELKEEEKKEPPPPPPKEEEKKVEPPQPVTVVLSVRMHCEACAQVLHKRIKKIKGVDSVETDVANDKVTVKGILDPEKLASEVHKKTKRPTTIVKEEKKEEEEGEKEEEPEKKEGEKKKEEEEVKEEEKEIKKSENWPSMSSMEYAYYPPPQMFSDENPNACFVM